MAAGGSARATFSGTHGACTSRRSGARAVSGDGGRRDVALRLKGRRVRPSAAQRKACPDRARGAGAAEARVVESRTEDGGGVAERAERSVARVEEVAHLHETGDRG